MKSQNLNHLSKKRVLKALLLGLIGLVVLSGCNGLTGPLADSQLLITPTPTFELPGPDDEDPIADCLLDKPLCVVKTSVEGFEGRPYLAASLAIDLEKTPFKGSDEELVMDGTVAISHEGTHAGDIAVKDHTIAIASPDADLILTNPEGDPIVSIIPSDHDFILNPNCRIFCDCGHCHPFGPHFSFDFDTGDILIVSIEGDLLITVDNANQQLTIHEDDSDNVRIIELGGDSNADLEGPGLVINDWNGNPVAKLVSNDGVLAVFEPNDAPIANISLVSPNYIAFTDHNGEPTVHLSLQDGRVFIDMGLGGEPVAIVTPNNKPGEGGQSILLTTFIPLSGWVHEVVDLSGTVEVYLKDAAGVHYDLDKVSVAIESADFTKYAKVEESEPAKAPTSAPSKSQPTKQSPSKEEPSPTKDTSKTKP